MDDKRVTYEVHTRGGCLEDFLAIIAVLLLVSYCTRSDKSKDFDEHTIETIHKQVSRVDSIWSNYDRSIEAGQSSEEHDSMP